MLKKTLGQRLRPVAVALTGVALMLVATACAGSSGSGSGSTGGAPAKRLVLRLGTDDDALAPSAEQITHFAREVAARSHGTVTVEPVWHAAGIGVPHWDQAVAKLVIGGKLDLAMVPTRAWDDLGVTSLRALNTPFLITTDTLTARVLGDGKLTRQLVSGLPAVGVSALGLYPEGLRHPFAFGPPLRGAADYQGGVVRMAWSRTENAMFEALGARSSDAEADPATMAGAESSYRLAPAGVATGNVTFYPKVNVLTAWAGLRDKLTKDQWAQVQSAAAATGQWVIANLPTDRNAAETFCAQSGRIAGASRAQVASLVAATAGVVRDLRQDPTSAAIIDSVTQMKQDDPRPDPVTSCRQPAPAAASFDGTYAFTLTATQARAAGVTDQGVIDENTGDFVWTFADGTWRLGQVYSSGPKAGTRSQTSGGYTLTGDHLKIYWSQDPGAWTQADVKLAADGSVTFRKVLDGGDAQAQALSEATFTTWPRSHS